MTSRATLDAPSVGSGCNNAALKDLAMIYFDNLTLNVGLGARGRTIIDSQTVTLPTDRPFAILGHDATELAALLMTITGSLLPFSGRLVRAATISFPIGGSAALKMNLSCRQNIKYICDIYGVTSGPIVEFVKTQSGIGESIDLPVASLPMPWRQRLIYSLGYGLPFQCYMFNEHVAVGDAEFRQRCLDLYDERMRSAGSIVATRSSRAAVRVATAGAILYGQRLHLYDDVRDAARDFDTLAATPQQGDAVDAADDSSDA
jgi:capsular polysaccharide transport system ATP-binding protein